MEGGFVQGMGWTCLEELVWGDEEHKWLPPGVLHTRGPGSYLTFCQVLAAEGIRKIVSMQGLLATLEAAERRKPHSHRRSNLQH